jgi:o-succinylbenzoate---CoA ligase
MRQLVALAMPGGPGFVDALQRIWDDGDAVFPIDLRLPPPARERVLQAMAPSAIVDATGHRSPLPNARPMDDGDALVVATSGSSGEPKGVILTHDAVLASALTTTGYIGRDPNDHWLACLPLAHVGGLSVITRALATSIPLTVLPRVDPDEIQRSFRSCQRHSIESTSGSSVASCWADLGRPPIVRRTALLPMA